MTIVTTEERRRRYRAKFCSTPGCGRQFRARGACYVHDPGPRGRRPFMDRLFARVDASGDCWEWTGGLDTKGYGHVALPSGTTTGAHRAVYELLVGPVADGLQLDHLCRNRTCVNPDHLEPVTPAENVRRALSRPHCRRGHLMTGRNVMETAGGNRRCRTCFNRWHRDFHRELRGTVAA